MDRVIVETNMLRGASNYDQWQETMVNIFLKDDLYEIVDLNSDLVQKKLAARSSTSKKTDEKVASWLILVRTPIAKGKSKVGDSTSYLPTDPTEIKEYKRRHEKALGMIRLSITNTVRPAIKRLADPTEVWLKLKLLYNRKTICGNMRIVDEGR